MKTQGKLQDRRDELLNKTSSFLNNVSVEDRKKKRIIYTIILWSILLIFSFLLLIITNKYYSSKYDKKENLFEDSKIEQVFIDSTRNTIDTFSSTDIK